MRRIRDLRTGALALALGLGCTGQLDPRIFPPPPGFEAGVLPAPADGGAETAPAAGCAEAPLIFTTYVCAACHDATGSNGGFDMASPAWETRLVGVKPKGGGASSPSVCASAAEDYLVAGSAPATGLFLDKLRPKTASSCGGQMPPIVPLSSDELACIQRWADALTAP